MKPPRTDYDQIAHLYDSQPYRAKDPDPELALFAARTANVRRALDLGCGTGNQLVANQQAIPGIHFVGADLFFGMLREASRKSREISWVRCNGEALPFKPATFDFVSNQYSLHHVHDKKRLLAEVHRVLSRGGLFVLQNVCPERMRDAALYRYFPEAWTLDERDFLSVADHETLLAEAGFVNVHADVETRSFMLTPEQLRASFARRDLNSELLALSDDEYERGLERARAVNEDVRSEVALLTLRAEKR